MRGYNPDDIRALMSVSEKIADLNYERFQQWNAPFTNDNATPALTTFKGDVYEPIDAENYTKSQWAYVNKHLRMLSGLYGLLRPLDLMQAYRLEMGIGLKNAAGKDLYAFWGGQISESLNKAVGNHKVLINLASNEYFKAVEKSAFQADILSLIHI